MIDIESLYKEYFSTVYKYLYSLSHDKEISEELTQETFCRAIKTLDKFREDCKVSVWLCQIAKYCWYEELKKTKPNIALNFDIPDYDLESIEDKLVNNQNKKIIYEKISKLDELTQKVMYYRIVSNMSFKEIGHILGKSENWSRVIFYRGKEKILKEVNYDK